MLPVAGMVEWSNALQAVREAGLLSSALVRAVAERNRAAGGRSQVAHCLKNRPHFTFYTAEATNAILYGA
jgi:hypothetical protein